MGIVIKYNKSRLIAIPAVHYRMAFAAEVNRICSSGAIRPDAIAVELEPEILGEVIQWIKELQPMESVFLKRFPMMLGLVDSNSGEAGVTEILCLSVTDSIIEAIRCGLELNIPVFGIDIPCVYGIESGTVLIEDAAKASISFSGYVNSNEDAADHLRDPVMDGRREDYMAGRLKYLITEYRNVVFTGGLAHWKRIKKLIADAQVEPLAAISTDFQLHSFRRVIVHPLIARSFMDKFPVLSTLYDASRKNCRYQHEARVNFPDAAKVGLGIVEAAYENYEEETVYESSLSIKKEATPSISELEMFIQKICLINRESAPDFHTLLLCAKSLMPNRFAKILTDILMNIKTDWASMVQFPGLPVIVPSGSQDDSMWFRMHGMLVDVMSPLPEDFFDRKHIYIHSETFLLNIPFSRKAGHGSSDPGWQWKDAPLMSNRHLSFNTWIWPPCEALLFGTAYQAGKMETDDENERKTLPFEGSMYDGFDVKATIRGMLRGDKKFQVKKTGRVRQIRAQENDRMATAVLLFSALPDPPDSGWYLLMAGSNIGDYVRNPSHFEKVVSEFGEYFISSLTYGSRIPVYEKGPFHPDSVDLLHGITLYGDPCLNAVTGARWVENSNYRCCPVLRNMNFSSLNDFYRRTHHIDLESENWQTALILAAIPFASDNLVVIAPDGFIPDSKVKALAARLHVQLRLLPVSHFPADRINQMRKRVLVRSIDGDGLQYAAETEMILGQKQDSFMELLPDFVK